MQTDKQARPRDKKKTDPFTGNCQNQQTDKRKVHSKGKKPCSNCATRHPFGACPAHAKTCNNCGKLNHHGRCCRSTVVKKQVNVVENKGYHDDTNPTEEFFIDTTEQGSNSEDWVQVITINNMERQFKLDTGAQLNVLPVREFDKLQPTPKLNSARVKLTAYGSTPIPVIGRCVTKIYYKANTHFLHFVIVPTVKTFNHLLESKHATSRI